jgi:hypothetical protein
MSQSASGPGSNIYSVRMQELAEKKKSLQGKLKALFYSKIFSNTL